MRPLTFYAGPGSNPATEKPPRLPIALISLLPFPHFAPTGHWRGTISTASVIFLTAKRGFYPVVPLLRLVILRRGGCVTSLAEIGAPHACPSRGCAAAHAKSVENGFVLSDLAGLGHGTRFPAQ